MNQYNELLKKQIQSSAFVIVLILVLAIVFLMLSKRNFFDDLGTIGKTAVGIFVVVIILLASVYFSVRIFRLNKDIHDQAYITYYGEFEVSSFKEGYVTLTGESDQVKLDGKVDLPGGKYSGTIVYAQNSKYVLDWSVD